MKCFYHPNTDAVGFCSRCGKAACRDCIEDIGGTMLCKGCMVQALNQQEERREVMAAKRELSREEAARKLRFSKRLFQVSAIGGFVFAVLSALTSIGDPRADPLLLTLVASPFVGGGTGYFIWACYWGIPAVWRGWWGAVKGFGCFLIANPITWIILAVALFEIPLFFGYLYGIFGGGIHEYLKCRRIAEGAAFRAEGS